MNAEQLHYTMVIEWSDEDSAYIVTAPDLPGCQTHGRTYAEAIQQGQEAIESWIEARTASGRPIPAPRGVAMPVSVTFPPSFKRWVAATARPDDVRIHYDQRHDTLAILLGEPSSASSIPGGDGLVFRIDRETNEFVGLEIYDCRRTFLPKHPELWLTYLLASSRVFQLVVRLGLWLVRHEPGADQAITSDTAMRAAVTVFRGISTAA